jgi:putative PIN family toxin of toxin-antitoxin system
VNPRRIVLDTNVIVAGLRSRNGASFKLLSIIDDQRLKLSVSVPLVIEYEEILRREQKKLRLTKTDIEDVLDFLCAIAEHKTIFYLWRPFLKDPEDDMLLELAVESYSEFIVTFNKADFKGVNQFGIEAVTPKELLKIIGELP